MGTSYVSVTDQFCGAGGSSLGAVAAGAELVMALNHWKLAIETHNSNFPQAGHDCTDVSACNPKRYPSTDILITSPECVNHSVAKGKKKSLYKKDLFGNVLVDPAEERSRATMWDVVRFAEVHRYNIIITENVPDVRKWVLWDSWLTAMQALGYEWKVVYLNSMFCWPTPQSRDRVYVVFWRKGNRAPDLDFHPPAWCERCDQDVLAVQSWKKSNKQFGVYGKRGQYWYRCPTCADIVRPYYYPAWTAIDWSYPITRIGDRDEPLSENTLARIRVGMERFRDQALLLETAYSHARNNRARPLSDTMMTQTGQQSLALLEHPAIVELRNHGTLRSVHEALATVAASGNHHALMLPFLTRHYNSRGDGGYLSRPVTEPLGTVTAQDHHSLTVPFITSYYGNTAPRGVDEPLGTVTGTDKHALVTPFIVSQYGGKSRNPVHSVNEPIMTVPGMALHHLAHPGQLPDIEDCGFRMLEPHEVGAAMAFPQTYKVKGNKRQRVKQYGNAVTPPVMALLMERCIATLS